MNLAGLSKVPQRKNIFFSLQGAVIEKVVSTAAFFSLTELERATAAPHQQL